MECSGNSGLPFLTGAIGNATWAGTPLATLLQEAGVPPEAIEVAFWGTDATDVEARDMTMRQHYARSVPGPLRKGEPTKKTGSTGGRSSGLKSFKPLNSPFG